MSSFGRDDLSHLDVAAHVNSVQDRVLSAMPHLQARRL